MKAMIFAAGFGTRLKPITDTCPKALVNVGNKPMLQHTIEHLIEHNFNEIIINIHYLGNQIKDFLQQHNNFNIRIEVADETSKILETGGGLLNAKYFFDDEQPFLVCNADILTTINLTSFYQFHLQQKPIATLAVRERQSSRYLLFDDNDCLIGWENTKTNEVKIPRNNKQNETLEELRTNNSDLLHKKAFSGYHIISPAIFNTCKRSGVFSMIDWYLDICAEHTIKCFTHQQDIWIDIGSIAQLQKANEIFADKKNVTKV